MSLPSVSIVMPVYNAEPYVGEAIRSMLGQRHADFECIVIDDGSTDGTDAVIRGFTDPRIRYLRNDGNRGLVYTLNRGVQEARGRYIARMDGDDISLPERLERQVAYLDGHPEVDLVATVVKLVDAAGNPMGYWKEDREHVTGQSILDFLPVNNCIAHPSVMVRAEVLKAFGYLDSQRQAEDYDLWLRHQPRLPQRVVLRVDDAGTRLPPGAHAHAHGQVPLPQEAHPVIRLVPVHELRQVRVVAFGEVGLRVASKLERGQVPRARGQLLARVGAHVELVPRPRVPVVRALVLQPHVGLPPFRVSVEAHAPVLSFAHHAATRTRRARGAPPA